MRQAYACLSRQLLGQTARKQHGLRGLITSRCCCMAKQLLLNSVRCMLQTHVAAGQPKSEHRGLQGHARTGEVSLRESRRVLRVTHT